MIHEKYVSDHRYDIAIIRLPTALVFNDYVQPVCIPSTPVAVGTECFATGWGDTRSTYRRLREISLFVTFLFFLFFVTSPRLQVATVDRFSRSIRQTTRFRARKCLLGVLMMNFHIYPLFSPKIWKFALRPMATSNDDNSGIFKDRSELFAPKWGFSGSGNLTASSKFASDRPLLPWQPTDVFWTQNWLKLG